MIGQESRSRIMRDHWDSGEKAIRQYRERISQLVRPGMRILHAGCGWDKRNISRPYAKSGKVVGVDLDPRVASRFHSEFHLGSLGALPFEKESFDLVFCEYVVEHLEDPLAAFREMQRVLNPGGRILVLTPNLYSYKALAAAITPQTFHIWMGRIRHGRGQEDDMYPTLYRCNTLRQIELLSTKAGLEFVAAQLITNGPTWFEKFPLVFEVFDHYHRLIGQSEFLRQLRCNLLVEMMKAEPGTRASA
jgi:SAM-dependent methyltransferase